MSKWNAEHQKGIEPTFLTRREGWGSEKTIFINEGGEGKSRRRLDQGMVAPILSSLPCFSEKEFTEKRNLTTLLKIPFKNLLYSVHLEVYKGQV